MKNKEEKIYTKANIKLSFLWVFLAFIIAIFGIFITYMYYRNSINPNPNVITSDKEEVEENTSEKENTYSLYINEGTNSYNTGSVFDTDLKLQEALKEKDKNFNNNGVLELTEDLQLSYKNEILNALYLKKYNKAIDYANEVIKNYDLSNSSFILFKAFLLEVKEMEDYGGWTFEKKQTFFKDLVSPELILFTFLNFTNQEQYNLIKNKNSSIIFGNPIYNITLKYNGNLTAGLYTEMFIDDAYFVVPDNIEGFKIMFEIENEEYILYYIRYEETNEIEVIYIENLGQNEVVSYNEYFK